MKVVVLDHHMPGDELPEADALVDPFLKDCPYPQKNLSGVVFYVLDAALA